jgi:hypothetical protein
VINARIAACLVAGLAAVAHTTPLASASVPASPDAPYSYDLQIPPRLQWDSNFGYCGETSFISAGMYFGQYTSQWTARSLASPGLAQTKEESQLLLGVNDMAAARRMKLQAVEFDSESQRSTPAYLAWVKSMVLRGHPVIIGVFLNMTAAEGELPGNSEYDHIVPVLGIGSRARLSSTDRRYRPTDVISFSDNGGAKRSSLHQARFSRFQLSRARANDPQAPLYSLQNRPMNYAAAVTGVLDPDRVTIPVRLAASADGEGLQDGVRMDAPPPPRPIELTATVTIPDPAVGYNVYLYDDFSEVPVRNFNALAANAIESWTIPPGSGSTWSKTITAMSDQTRAFRAVPVTAP